MSVRLFLAAALITGCSETQTTRSTTAPAEVEEITVTPETQEKFISALESNGCILNAETNIPVMAASGLGVGEFLYTIRYMSNAGRIKTIAPSTHRLISKTCDRTA